MATVSMGELVADLADEQADLDLLVAALDEAGWALATPAPGWSVRDQIGHLAFFDDTALLAVTEPGRFSAMAEEMTAGAARGADPMAEHLERGRSMPGAQVLSWWRSARAELLGAVADLDAGARVPWYGPPMSAASFVSARLMETWAHGQDVADALGAWRPPTGRLRHVAQIGVRARLFSFLGRGLEPPGEPVRVELVGPSGERWCWGEQDAPERVSGSALGFCLVVTQRRHLADTDLVVEGDGACRWMAIAQAFAGPPGPGRQPTTAS